MAKVIPGFIIASVFWFFMFSPWTKDLFNFWGIMMLAAGSLATYGLIAGRENLKRLYRFEFQYIIIGIVSAAMLYLIFLIGNQISKEIFDFAESQVSGVYSTKSQLDKLWIGLALFFWIGPAEEIFWRGFAQYHLEERFGKFTGFLITTAVYAFVHIWAFNFMLFMASLIVGLFWGYMFMRYRNIWPSLISHAIWDLFIFVIIPVS